MNRILKETMLLLLRGNLSKQRKKAVKKLLLFFADVDGIDLHRVDWNFRYNCGSQSYRMLVSVC